MGYLRRDAVRDASVPLKPVQQAWQELQKYGPTFFDLEDGPAWLTYERLIVTEVGLGYRECCYASAEVQDELRPYYVFSGEAEVANWARKIRADAYVPAWE